MTDELRRHIQAPSPNLDLQHSVDPTLLIAILVQFVSSVLAQSRHRSPMRSLLSSGAELEVRY
jgi:hypothetical protein